jgi:hypothetical protein
MLLCGLFYLIHLTVAPDNILAVDTNMPYLANDFILF